MEGDTSSAQTARDACKRPNGPTLSGVQAAKQILDAIARHDGWRAVLHLCNLMGLRYDT